MTRRLLLLLLLVALSGCIKDERVAPQEDAGDGAATDGTSITGVVKDLEGFAIVLANVTLTDSVGATRNTTTDIDGAFAFVVPAGDYQVSVAKEGYRSATKPVGTTATNTSASLIFTLLQIDPLPFEETVPFSGIFQCAAEYVIITGSCDTGSTTFGGPGAFTQTNRFDVPVKTGWQSVVVDVSFDLADHPGIDALRVVARAVGDDNALNSYEQYGRFQSQTSFTFRLEPDQTYPDGVAPVPGNSTDFQFEVYPQGYGWHDVCIPGPVPMYGGTCTLGVGAAIDLQFDLFVTAWYNGPAPEGWTKL